MGYKCYTENFIYFSQMFVLKDAFPVEIILHHGGHKYER